MWACRAAHSRCDDGRERAPFCRASRRMVAAYAQSPQPLGTRRGCGVAATAAAAETAGFDRFGFTDRPAPAPTDRWLQGSGHDSLNPFVARGFAAVHTTKLRLIPNVVVLPSRNPFAVTNTGAPRYATRRWRRSARSGPTMRCQWMAVPLPTARGITAHLRPPSHPHPPHLDRREWREWRRRVVGMATADARSRRLRRLVQTRAHGGDGGHRKPHGRHRRFAPPL
jgi:hypothetical protein